MHPKSLMKVISGKRYNTDTATLLASDEYWDGNNMERSGRNTFLYKTPGGAFFEVTLSQWQGERDRIIPLNRDQAMELWEHLPEREVDYEDAFDVIVEDASAGRPTYYGQPMKQTAIWLPDNMIQWLKSQPDGMGAAVRDLIAQQMQIKK